MADIFLSYAREDRPHAELLAANLSRRGWTVWWDRKIRFGRSFRRVIERQLDKARCVIVLWSKHAVESDWVISEAAEGLRRGILMPVRIEDVRVPLEFRSLHTADLFGEDRDGQLDECAAAIGMLVPAYNDNTDDDTQSDVAAATTGGHQPRRRRVSAMQIVGFAGFALVLILAISLALSGDLRRIIGLSHDKLPGVEARLVMRPLEDPDHNVRPFQTALEVKVPPAAIAKVSVGLQRFVEGAVLVVDESGGLYQKWGTAAHHNLKHELALLPGHKYFVSSWYKQVPDKGENLPWFPSTQVLQRPRGSAQLTVFHDPSGDVDATVDVNVIGLAQQ